MKNIACGQRFLNKGEGCRKLVQRCHNLPQLNSCASFLSHGLKKPTILDDLVFAIFMNNFCDFFIV